jgi:hypothetical protein
MRHAIASLIVLAGLSTTAVAQEAAAPAPAPAPEAAAPAAAPAAPEATTPPAAAPEAAPAAPAEPPPTVPTTGDGAAVISLIEKICVPLVRGGSLDQLAAAQGMKKNRRDGSYSMVLGAKPYDIVVASPGSNKDVCTLTVHYAIGQERPIVTGLNIWSFLHQPELKMQRNDFAVGPDGVKRVTLSWEHFTDHESTGLVMVQLKKPDGSSLNPKFDEASVLYSERKF